MRVRRGEEVRKSEILSAALAIGHEVGYQSIRWEALASRAQCSVGLVGKYFGTMNQLRRAIVSHAIDQKDLRVIAQAIVAGEPKVKSIDAGLKRRAMEYALANGCA